MKKRMLSLLCVLALCLGLLPVTASAAGPEWTYDSNAQTLTCTIGEETITLKEVTAGAKNNLTIGINRNFSGTALDLSGTVTDESGNTYTITSIGYNAFLFNTNLQSIVLPSSLTSIGSVAFSGCSGLKSIELLGDLKSIGNSAFSGCSSLTTIDLPDGLESIGESAFQDCSGLTAIKLSASLTSIGQKAFYGCSGLTSIELPEGVTSIGDYAFYNCSGLTSIKLPEGVTSIGDYAFYNCSGLTSIKLPEGLESIGDCAFFSCSSLDTIQLPDGLESIKIGTFSGCSSLTSIELPKGLKSLGKSTFYGCSSLTTINLPDSVESIGERAFQNCRGLTSIKLSTNLTSIGQYAFTGCSGLTKIDLPESLTSIGGYAFADFSGLTTIVLPKGLESIGERAFSGCSGLTTIDLPDSVESIGEYAFQNCRGLTSIKLSTSLTSIGQYAFSGCSGLTKIDLPESLTSIGESAFYGCSSLTSIELPEGLESIGNRTFDNCSGLTSIDLPDGVTSIGGSAFYGCSGLTSIDLPDGLTSIGTYAFSGCSSLTSIDLPDGLTSIGAYAFGSCNNLSTIILLSEKPPTIIPFSSGNVSLGFPETTQIFVPLESVGEYKEDYNWKNYADRISPINGNLSISCPTSPQMEEGALTPVTITLKNTGNVPLTSLTASLTNGEEYFTITGLGSTLAAEEETTFTILPNADLVPGTYSATVQVESNLAEPVTGSFTLTVVAEYRPILTPTKTLSQQAMDKIEAAKDGDTVEITLSTGNTKLDKEVFEELAGQDITLVVKLSGGVSWTVNGQDIPENATLTDIDLGVSMNTSTIPVNVINQVTGEKSAVQMTLAHDGEFGFTMTLTAPVGAENKGLWANLYYYDAISKRMLFEAAAQVDEDGKASLPFDHAGEFAIVLDTKSHELPFDDVNVGDWFQAAVEYVYRNGIMTGTSATTFEPGTTLSRAMVAQILYNLEGQPTVEGESTFSDTSTHWAAKAIAWAKQTGVVAGYEDNTFQPNKAVTREELAQMLYNYAKYKDYDLTASGDLTAFPDGEEVSSWAETAMAWANGNKLINGHDNGTLEPGGDSTRAQAASILMNFDVNLAN